MIIKNGLVFQEDGSFVKKEPVHLKMADWQLLRQKYLTKPNTTLKD